jgi:hypothetical protein
MPIFVVPAKRRAGESPRDARAGTHDHRSDELRGAGVMGPRLRGDDAGA